MDTQSNGADICVADGEYQRNVEALNERVQELRVLERANDVCFRARNEEAQSKRIDARAMLMDQFGIDSAFVRIPVLARVLNLTPAGIYAAIREDRFFMPHRMMFSVPAVKLDDLVEWYCMDEKGAQPTTKRRSGGAIVDTVSDGQACTQPKEIGTVVEARPCAATESPTTSVGILARQNVDRIEGDAERLKREKQAIIKSVRERMQAR
jgi:hypothetical protein